jgi:hypothetical protein
VNLSFIFSFQHRLTHVLGLMAPRLLRELHVVVLLLRIVNVEASQLGIASSN